MKPERISITGTMDKIELDSFIGNPHTALLNRLFEKLWAYEKEHMVVIGGIDVAHKYNKDGSLTYQIKALGF